MVETLRVTESLEDRLDTQRKALGGLLARFTADRDVLINSVHECERKLADFAARLDAIDLTQANQVSEGPQPDVGPEISALRQLVERVQSEQLNATALARATAGDAMARADAALQHVEDLAATQRASATAAEALLARLEQEREGVLAAVHECERRVADFVARADEVTAPVEPRLAVQELAELHEVRQLLEQAQSEQRQAETTIRTGTEELAAARRRFEEHADGLRAQIAETHDTTVAALHKCEQEIGVLAARLDASVADQRQVGVEVRALREQLTARVHDARRRIEPLRAALDGANRNRQERGHVGTVFDRPAADIEGVRSEVAPGAIAALTAQVQALGAQVETLRQQAVHQRERVFDVGGSESGSTGAAPHTVAPPLRSRSRSAMVALGVVVVVLGSLAALGWHDGSSWGGSSEPPSAESLWAAGGSKMVACDFATALTVETSYAGVPVVAAAAAAPRARSYMPVIAVVLMGGCLTAVAVWRMRKNRMANVIPHGRPAS